ncbi:major facilitator superfamily transporter [Fusarium mexicanum]|uniref:Major facilitator superfamily transporter n=1 Tax=Fusarium mexicanum TaxID=751941 RepID=A0A8H5IKQ7_9HYPO|nr:major facilitator superfamily transporter [Fusarium mexicanum]
MIREAPKVTLWPLQILPDDSTIIKAIQSGDAHAAQLIIRAKEVSPFAVSIKGENLLSLIATEILEVIFNLYFRFVDPDERWGPKYSDKERKLAESTFHRLQRLFEFVLKQGADPAQKSGTGRLLEGSEWTLCCPNGPGEASALALRYTFDIHQGCFEEWVPLEDALTDTFQNFFSRRLKVVEYLSSSIEDDLDRIFEMEHFDQASAIVGATEKAIQLSLLYASPMKGLRRAKDSIPFVRNCVVQEVCAMLPAVDCFIPTIEDRMLDWCNEWEQRCTEEATHANELFCLLHARQAHGLYIGYKRRNTQLDALDKDPPTYLSETHVPLANDDFSGASDSKEMEEVVDHLHVKWNTLNRVIEARRKHHAHFYSISYDYGHQAYIDKLVSHRHIVLLALGRARKRLMAILYKKEQWYSWVRDVQDDEEANREKEQKKLKQEAALFKRHMKQMEARMELMRKREEQKLQDAFLEEAYRERMAMNEDADDEAWDPIEDMEDEQRHRYIDLIKHSLWMEVEVDDPAVKKPASTERVIKEVESHRFKKKGKKPKRQRKTKVTICGKSIWNHASENAMSRDGWLQFSVMAKDCDLKHAIQLCRNWSEFSDLNLLTLWQYFPASNWTSWGQDRFMQQLQQLGFFPYFTDFDADKYSHHHQIGRRSQGRRQHDIVETRNILVGNMKRNDPVTRRFLQYLLMRRGELLVMVRDGKTGRVITAPDDEQLWTYRKKQGLGRASKNDWFNILEVGPDFMKLTDILREWRFGFDDYYDVFIWDFVPGEPHMDLYNIAVMELRNAWRMRTPRDMYVHMESLLRSLHRNEKIMRTRQIKPGEDLKSLWDTIADERSEFRLFDVSNKKVTMRKDTELAESPYMFYNKANEVEDAILFPDELTSDRKSVAFREIRNGVASIEDGILPSTARHFVKGLEAINKGKDPMKAMRMAKHDDENNIWGLPKVWETALLQARSDKLKKSQKALLQRMGLLNSYKTLSYDRRLEESDPMEMMERYRAFSFKESFHAGDLEPGYNAKYNLLQETLRAMLKTPHWLDLRGDYDDYVQDPQYPWPHSFIVQDIVQAFAMIAMFFPNSDVAKLPTMFVNSSQCDEFRKSGVFDPRERSKVRPNRRTRTSYKFREKEFWKEWKDFYKTERYFGDVYPMEWSLAVRPIIAHLYQAGVIGPAYMQNHPEVVLGMVTANTEPHRPDKLDLFINYQDQYGNFPMTYPPNFVDPSKWPQVILTARTFSSKHPTARFAILRLWSAPHYYPFMVGMFNRRNTSFLDSRGQSWEWKFVPKDMPGSEFSAHHTTGKRLDVLKDKFGDRVVHRGDLILVMGVDEDDLLRFCTAVTFAMQTKPWLREIDLWKNFINVDFEFLLDLESFWLD